MSSISTHRLELIPATIPLLEAARHGNFALSDALQAELPATWPPEHYDAGTIEYAITALRNNPDVAGWGTYFFLRRDREGTGYADRLIGFGGFKGPPTEDGTVELGYSVVPEFQRQGLATEAVQGLLHHAFSDPRVTTVMAETYPELIPSQEVLRKAGFTFVGPGSEERVIRFALERDSWTPR
jgi:RimJ/RimL family protein N-acetyltransferase